jgi:large subunit ribosomal protein L23
MHPYEVLKRPILTEKTDYQSDALHRYTFEVDVRANKHLVRDAVQTVFNVTVQDVHIIKCTHVPSSGCLAGTWGIPGLEEGIVTWLPARASVSLRASSLPGSRMIRKPRN